MNNNKKILILGKLPPPYMGPSIATKIILESELKNRFTLIHLDTRINKKISSFGKWNFSKMFRNIGIYLEMLRLNLYHRPDLVLIPISQTTMGFIKDAGFILIAKLFARKVIIQLRGSNFKKWISESSFVTKSFVKFILGTTQGCIVLGNNLKYLFKDYYPDDKIFVVPNGGDYNFPTKTIAKEEFRILYLANLFESKGVEDVFTAISILKKTTDRKFSADFIGEWVNDKTKYYCLDLLEKESLPIRIHTSSVSDKKLNFLSEANVFVFPPREPEGHPWSIIEAMAAGLPVISTDQGAIIESVIDNVNGFIVNIKDPKQIAEKIKLLIENEMLCNKMGEESRRIYERNFTEQKMIDNLTEVFNKVIAEP